MCCECVERYAEGGVIHLPLMAILDLCEDVAHELEDQAPDVDVDEDADDDE